MIRPITPGELMNELNALRTEREHMQRTCEAARMIIGPLSARPDLLDATDDVVRELVRLRKVREVLIEAADRLRVELERFKAGAA